jgi:hypothetical protein
VAFGWPSRSKTWTTPFHTGWLWNVSWTGTVWASVALHFAHYNFVRMHQTIRRTPAMASGVSRTLWAMDDLVDRTTAN